VQAACRSDGLGHSGFPTPGGEEEGAEERGVCDERLKPDDFAALSTELLGRGNRIRFRARGRSMSPLIRDGDVLTVEPARLGDLRVGEVALHRIGERQVVAHRVVGCRAEDGRRVLTTRGDSVLGAPDRVSEVDVLGRVIERERNGRVVRLNGWLRRLGGRLLVPLLTSRSMAARFLGWGRRLATRLCGRA